MAVTVSVRQTGRSQNVQRSSLDGAGMRTDRSNCFGGFVDVADIDTAEASCSGNRLWNSSSLAGCISTDDKD